jgi:hypothetical protein
LLRALGADAYDPSRRQYPPSTRDDLDFGWFQLSLPVADVAASRAFYEKVGFRRLSDTLLQSDDCLVALYGLWLERPQLIFWQGDIDGIERTFTERGLEFRPRFNDAKGTGAMLISPDGHPHYAGDACTNCGRQRCFSHAYPLVHCALSVSVCRFSLRGRCCYRHQIRMSAQRSCSLGDRRLAVASRRGVDRLDWLCVANDREAPEADMALARR